ncbi:MAG TPA: cellulase family glycosylhydrolase, partial [Pseudomonadales bacterium]|nr:cellulase family glycosylhydrolase [Pseudomonadales bacterium]
ARSFEWMKRYTGANFVRFTLSWEGIHPGPDQIEYAYLDDLIAQMREAFKQQIYVFLDFHNDLYSRYLFDAQSPFTGNGAPEWIVKGDEYPAARCQPVCFVWGQSFMANPAVRLGYQHFFDNAAIQTSAGERHVQDEFIWQLNKVLSYVKSKLSEEEFDWITGVEPMNEPFYGLGHKDTADFFDNEKLWPFFQRVRAALNAQGWERKWVFVEPSLFWDTNAGVFLPPTGGHYLKSQPGPGFVFAPHFYDAARMGITNLNKVHNGEYFKNIDSVRNEARYLGLPAVLGEFGMWLKDQHGGAKDYARSVHGVYQALEASDAQHTEKDRRLDFHTPLISSTQWHWDIYKDQHHEYQNGNPRKLKTAGDGWNGEDFSAIKNDSLTVNPAVVARAYPRRVDGNIVSFYYNDLAEDGAGTVLDWAEIRTSQNSYFANKQFALLIWQGGQGQESELFLPATFNPLKTVVITERAITQGQTLLQSEFSRGVSGYRLRLAAAPVVAENALHFALVVNDPLENSATLTALQAQLIQQINELEHPVYLRGRMAGLNYPAEDGRPEAVSLVASEQHFLFFRWVGLQWRAAQPVQILKAGQPVKVAAAIGSATILTRVGKMQSLQVCEQNDPARCSRLLQFD